MRHKHFLQTFLVGAIALGAVTFLPSFVPSLAQTAEASHYDAGIFDHRVIDFNRRIVEFRLRTFWRRSAFCPRTQTVAQCAARTFNFVLRPLGRTVSKPDVILVAKVVSQDLSIDRIEFFGTVRYTYPNTGKFKAAFVGCCWRGTQGRTGTSWLLETDVDLTTRYSSPTINNPSFFTWCVGVPFALQVNATDQNVPPRTPLTYSLYTGAYGTGSTGARRNPANAVYGANRMTIDSAGIIRWPTPLQGNWVVTVYVKNSANKQANWDFQVSVQTTCPNRNRPVITLSSNTVTTRPGGRVCTNVTCRDADTNDRLTFIVAPLLPGATVAPAGLQANPRTWQYCYTTKASDEGRDLAVLFTCRDNGNPKLSSDTRLRISVTKERPPTITFNRPTPSTINEGATFTFTATAADPDNNGINAHTISGLPSFCRATLNSAKTLYSITCKPNFTHGTRTYNMVFKATDKDATPKSTSKTFTLVVRDVNRRPTIRLTPTNASVAPGQRACTRVTVADADAGDTLRVTVSPAKPGATGVPTAAVRNPTTFTYCWTPTSTDAGQTSTINFTVRDPKNLSASTSYKVTVATQKPPVIGFTPTGGSKTIFEGDTYSWTVKATDPEGKGITAFSVSGLPSFCTSQKIGSDTIKITCKPGYTDGTKVYNMTFTAKDGDSIPKTSTVPFTLVVVDKNRPPKITFSRTSATVDPGTRVCFTVTGSDVDKGDKLTFTMTPSLPGATATPSGLQTNPRRWTYCYTTKGIDEGKTITIIGLVVDNGTPNLSDQTTFTLKVNPEKPPVITMTPSANPKTVKEGESIKFRVSTTDPDGNGIAKFDLTGLPPFCKAKKISISVYEIECKPGFSDGNKSFPVTFTSTDKDLAPKSTKFTVTIGVTEVNRTPKATTPKAQTACEGEEFKYEIKASDPDGDKLSYTATGLPNGFSIDKDSGIITGKPTQAEVGDYNVTVVVNDNRGNKVTLKFKLTVKPNNDAPKFTSQAPTKGKEKEPYVYKPKIEDVDPNDKHTYKLTQGPSGASVNASTGELRWTPGASTVGKSYDFEMTVCDDGKAKCDGSKKPLCDKQNWTITITNANDAPVLKCSDAPKVAYSGKDIDYRPVSTDPDSGDTQAWSLESGPAGATTDPKTGRTQWTPTAQDAGKTYTFNIKVCDRGKKCATCSFKVKVDQPCILDSDCATGLICSASQNPRVCIKPGCSEKTPECADAKEFCWDDTCKKDPCDGKTCPAGTACRPTDGACIKPCAGVKCAADEMCKDGTCVKDECTKAGSPCPQGQVCNTDDPKAPKCVLDPCNTGNCKYQRVCADGKCINDPCLRMKCPEGTQRCLAGQCVDREDCQVDIDCKGDQVCISQKCYEPSCYTKNPKCDDKTKLCVASECKEDPCNGPNAIQCAQDEFCRATDGKCIGSCAGVTCAQGEKCEDGKCITDPCDGVTCKAGEVCVEGTCEKARCDESSPCRHGRVCNPEANVCEDDPCQYIKCPDPKHVCRYGQCVLPPDCVFDNDCPGTALCVNNKCVVPKCDPDNSCPAGKVCSNGVCLDDPCQGVQCKENEVCKGGQCVGTCAGVSCPEGEICLDGTCTQDPCYNKNCPEGEVCFNGQCVENKCKKPDLCEKGRRCQVDKCVDDPCNGITCPKGLTCKDGQCSGDLPCKNDADCPGDSVCIDQVCKDPGCYKTPCSEEGKICLKGQCVDGPCKDKQCADDETCRPSDGACVKRCPTCDTGERCNDGVCEKDPCADVECKEGERCEDGKCVADACVKPDTSLCKFQRACLDESCGDDPCYEVKCPEGFTCRNGICFGGGTGPDEERLDEEPPSEEEPTEEPTEEPSSETTPDDAGPDYPEVIAGGGCGCSTSQSGTTAFAFFSLFFLVMVPVLRRRRKED